jgi:hypothetical protein
MEVRASFEGSVSGNWSSGVERQTVNSSVIRSVGYDSDRRLLEIEFHHGHVYRYVGVPEFLYRGLMLASSKGSFFNTRIVDRYPHDQVT